MPNGSIVSLLDNAKELEKSYDWTGASEFYKKASKSCQQDRDVLKAADLIERCGFCFYRAAFQAQTNAEFRERMEQSIKAYQKEIDLLAKTEEKNRQAMIKQAQALVVYIQSWLETDLQKKKELLDEWWTLENQVLEAYESIRDFNSVGVVCTDMIESSLHARLWLSNHSEEVIMEEQALGLAEKAIGALLKSGGDYELARAYCFASVWYCSQSHAAPEFRDKRIQLIKTGHDYAKKALELSSKTGDAWLIGWTYYAAYTATVYYELNHTLAADYGEENHKFGNTARDNLLLAYGKSNSSYSLRMLAEFFEDPDKQRSSFKKASTLGEECRGLSQIIDHMTNVCWGYSNEISALTWLAAIEPDPRNKQGILKEAIRLNREGLEVTRDWKRLSFVLYESLSDGLRLLSGTKSDVDEKKALLLEAQSLQKEFVAEIEEAIPFNYAPQSLAHYNLGLVEIELAKVETDKIGKAEALERAMFALEKSGELLEKIVQVHPETEFMIQVLGKHSDRLGRVQQQYYHLTKDEESLSGAVESHVKAAAAFTRGEMPAHAAESYWYIAQLQDHMGEHQEASKNYESAAQAYDAASVKIPQLKGFYNDYSLYMRAWSKIEQARHAHSIEEYDEARQNYEKAAKLHESTEPWSYLSPNYFAWGIMEEAEGLSRKEYTEQAKTTFQKALGQFEKAESFIKQEIGETATTEEKELNQRLLHSSELRRKYCQARILLEDAKLLDKQAKYLQSSKNYREAAQGIEPIIEKVESEAERKELELLAVLCRAWEKMAAAEETNSPESYNEAAILFEQAEKRCYTRKASLWALGNSNFCKGLAAGGRYRGSMDLKENALAKSYLQSAASAYLQAGFKNASEYAKATQRLFDAYLFMSQAESEVSPENKAKRYQMAENLLEMAAGSFVSAGQPEKSAQVQQIVSTVREEKALAVSLSEVLHAPLITSSTMSFAAPSSTSEVSVGLRNFEHANVQANLIAGMKEVKVGESFCLTVEFVNAGKEPALLIRVEDFVPPDFVVVEKPEIYRLEDSCLNMKGKQLAPLKLVEAKVVLQPSKKGLYHLRPTVHYLDELGQDKSLQLKSVEIRVEEVVLADRVSTGTRELDSLLLGGVPKEYAVVLTGVPSDERELLIKNFLEAGTKEGQTSFYVTTEAVGLEGLLEKSGFCLFLCNPKPKVEVPDLPNVFKLRGKTDLTNLNIALLKAYRNVEPSSKKRVCIGIVSDVLVDFEVKATRNWISELITDLVSKGFTVLAVFDPSMHPADQANAIVNLFDGEINLTQTEDPMECRKSLRVKKLRNQDFIKNSVCLTRPPV